MEQAADGPRNTKPKSCMRKPGVMLRVTPGFAV
jgi:hypothetical protein